MHAVYNHYSSAEKIARAGLKAACEFDLHSSAPCMLKSIRIGKPVVRGRTFTKKKQKPSTLKLIA